MEGCGYRGCIGDEFFFSPTHVALIAERCPHCGVVEIDFNRFVGNTHNKNRAASGQPRISGIGVSN